MKKKSNDISFGVQPFWGFLAFWVTQDIAMKFFFRKKIIEGIDNLSAVDGTVILAPTHRSRWDGLILTFALGRRVTNKDCRFMVTKSEMTGIQGWFLKRLGCFSINQDSPSHYSIRYALELIIRNEQLVIFPEGRINKNGKKIPLKQGLFRLAKLASKKGKSVTIIPIGIAYDRIKPKFGSKVALCIEKPMNIKYFSDSSIKDFNNCLRRGINDAELKALSLVGR